MKIYLFLSIIMLGSFGVKAQPVLQRTDLAKGVKISFSIGSATDPGAAGANVTWDFSGLPVSNGGSFEAIDPATAPHHSSFPDCNQVYKVSTSTTFYNYYRVSSSAFDWVGYRMGLVNADLTPNPLRFVKFPFHFNEQFSDTVKSTDLSFDYISTVVYDGYGTLKTPFGTYSNAIRVKTYTTTDTAYEWYIADANYFTYAIVQIANGTTRIYKMPSTAVDEVNEHSPGRFYPNPANGLFFAETATPVQMIIYDAAGRKAASYTLNGNATLDLRTLPAGTYLYQVTDMISGENTTGKFELKY